MLQADMAEKASDMMTVTDFDTVAIKTALDYMYAGYLKREPTMDYQQLVNVAKFGQKYAVRGLVKSCFEQLHLTANVVNVFDILKNIETENFEDLELRSNLIRYIV
jgi:hypothetical protein